MSDDSEQKQRLSRVHIVVWWPEWVDYFRSFFSDTHWLNRTFN